MMVIIDLISIIDFIKVINYSFNLLINQENQIKISGNLSYNIQKINRIHLNLRTRRLKINSNSIEFDKCTSHVYSFHKLKDLMLMQT